jgi:hypothetical protein
MGAQTLTGSDGVREERLLRSEQSKQGCSGDAVMVGVWVQNLWNGGLSKLCGEKGAREGIGLTGVAMREEGFEGRHAGESGLPGEMTLANC